MSKKESTQTSRLGETRMRLHWKEIVKAVETTAQQPQQRGYNNFQQYRNNNYRPNNYTWKGRVGQRQQTKFQYNRSTPQTYTKPVVATSTATTPTTATTTNVAAFELDPAAQPLGAEGGETITIPINQFFELASRAGEEVDDNDIVSALADLNFC